MKIVKYKKFLNESQRANMISQQAKKDILAWMASPRHTLSNETVDELEKNDSIRSANKVTLYRGLLFVSTIPDINSEYFNYSSEKHSSWTYSIETATRFAKFNKVGTGNGFLDFFMSSQREGMIDGELGIIISREFQPKEILIDSTHVKNKLNALYGDEKEVIVNPFTDKCKIEKIYTKKESYNSFEEFQNRKKENNYEKS